MEIMLSHFGIGMAYDALDGLNIHAQRLHKGCPKSDENDTRATGTEK